MRVLAFTGMPGAGKTEAVQVTRSMGLPVVSMGDLVRAEVERRGASGTDASTGSVATQVREQQGMDAWAVRTLEEIRDRHAGAPFVVVDGVRNWEEVARFRKDLGDTFVLVAITTGPDQRLQRLKDRGRPDDPATQDEAESRDERELGWGIARAIAMADHAIPNEGDLADFHERVGALVRELLG